MPCFRSQIVNNCVRVHIAGKRMSRHSEFNVWTKGGGGGEGEGGAGV